jgi:hypothetical protein
MRLISFPRKLDGVQDDRALRGGVELGAGHDADLRHLGRGLAAVVGGVHGAQGEVAPGADAPEALVVEHLAVGIDAVDARGVHDQRGDLRGLVGIVLVLLRVEIALLLEQWVQAAEGLIDLHAAAEAHLLQLRQQGGEHQVVGAAAAQADVGAGDLDDLVVLALVLAAEARVAEGGERVGGDGHRAVLLHRDDGGHSSTRRMSASTCAR